MLNRTAFTSLLFFTQLTVSLSGAALSPSTGTAAQSPAASPAVSRVPAHAHLSKALESKANWLWEHDPETGGSSNGTSNYPIYPDGRNGLAGRQFVASYADKGGQRYHLSFGRDAKATHFVYEANVYLVDPSQVENVEMDMNQVMSDGRTVIFGMQCAAGSGTWEYTSVDKSGTHWHPSNIPCNPHNWGTKKWHHVQLASHRDEDGMVTYDWIEFDGVYAEFPGTTVPSAEALRWTPKDLLLNFQIDGASKSGIMDAYVNNLTVSRW